MWHGLIYNLIDHHIEWTIGFQNYKQKDILQNYLIAQKKDDSGLLLVLEVKKKRINKLFNIQGRGNRTLGSRVIR